MSNLVHRIVKMIVLRDWVGLTLTLGFLSFRSRRVGTGELKVKEEEKMSRRNRIVVLGTGGRTSTSPRAE